MKHNEEFDHILNGLEGGRRNGVKRTILREFLAFLETVNRG